MATADQHNDERQRFLILSHKDTDILTLSSAKLMLPHHFPRIESADLCSLAGDQDMTDVLEEKAGSALPMAEGPRLVIIVRLLGRGLPGFQRLLDFANTRNHKLIVVSGIPGSFEPDLTAMCTVATEIINQVMAYFHADGCASNMANMFKFLADMLFEQRFGYEKPTPQPDHGLYHPRFGNRDEASLRAYLKDCRCAVLFYRCHYLSGNKVFVDALLDELEASYCICICLYCSARSTQELDGTTVTTILPLLLFFHLISFSNS